MQRHATATILLFPVTITVGNYGNYLTLQAIFGLIIASNDVNAKSIYARRDIEFVYLIFITKGEVE